MVAVNAVHPAYLAKVMIDKLLARKEKSAMIVTASVAGLRSMAGNTI